VDGKLIEQVIDNLIDNAIQVRAGRQRDSHRCNVAKQPKSKSPSPIRDRVSKA